MNISTIDKIKLRAIACTVPEHVIDNKRFAVEHFTEDMTGTLQALGVLRRHTCINRETTALTLGVESAKRLFSEINYDPSNIGAIVFVTLTPDSLMPNNASAAHFLLGLPANCAAFDINHACSGYTYGLWVSSMICANIRKDVLLLDADTNSYYAAVKDKSTGLLFGDAGSASLICYNEEVPQTNFCFFTDAEKRDALTLPGFGFKYPLTDDSLKFKTREDGSIRRDIDMFMDGENVFSYVVSKVPKQVKNLLNEIEMEPEEYKALVLHQANAFMLRQMARKIGFDKTQLPFSIQEYGNTSSVSIPLTIASNKEVWGFDGLCLLVGMGAGLSTGIVSVDLSSLEYAKVFQGEF